MIVMIRKINDYNTISQIEAVTNNFKTLVNEAKTIKLKDNLEYTLARQFLENFERQNCRQCVECHCRGMVLKFRYPTIGFFADNSGQFINFKLA